ncbi:Tat pathway signal protein [Actinomyces sp. 2119]|uniref:ABC transporter permease n=1 Tax=Actinomyces sp. 2119 TaxID=2321393 RepID=UPI000E6B6801|nr:Tat pathway signal protein [Actinomyces sp. 2119]RJF40225.1 Tat pathway signal protein [Actinomyces sp. 2119]
MIHHDDLRGMGHALRLTARRLRVQVLAWILPLWLGMASFAPTYQDAYFSDADGAGGAGGNAVVEALRASPGTRLLYGELPEPGTIGQLVEWEGATYLLVCTALMAVLLTCRLMRADEDEGLTELLRSAGAGRWVPFLAPVLVTWAAVGVLAAFVGSTLMAEAHGIEALTAPGAWALAGVTAIVGWGFAGLAAVVCQLARSVAGARPLALACVGVAFVVRVLADESGAAWLRWTTPLGWRDLVAPYTDDDPVPLAACTAICGMLVATAGALYAHREYAGGYLPDRATSRRRWRIHGYADLLTRLSTRTTLIWAAAVACFSALFGSTTESILEMMRDDRIAAYVDVLVQADVGVMAQFMSLMTVLLVLLIAVAATGQAGRLATDETAGLVDAEVAVGMPRWRLFLTQAASAVVVAAVLLVLCGTVLATATATQVTADHAVERAFVFTVSQLPGVLAAIGITLAVIGVAPRRFGIVWAVIAWSAFARLLGGLVELPRWAQELSVVGHHLDVVSDPDWMPLAVQAAVGLVGTFLGLVAYQHRDLSR